MATMTCILTVCEVSEISCIFLLQQTQVATGLIPYFERFMQVLPMLGRWPPQEPMKCLHLMDRAGAITVARVNLHKSCAGEVVNEFARRVSPGY